MSEKPCTIPFKINSLSGSFQRHSSQAGKCCRRGGREGGEGASNGNFLARRGWQQMGLDPCGRWCCGCHSMHGTHGQICNVEACSQQGCWSGHILASHCGDQTVFVGEKSCLIREMAWHQQQVGHEETAASWSCCQLRKGSQPQPAPCGIPRHIWWRTSTGIVVPCWLSWLDSQHTVGPGGGWRHP